MAGNVLRRDSVGNGGNQITRPVQEQKGRGLAELISDEIFYIEAAEKTKPTIETIKFVNHGIH